MTPAPHLFLLALLAGCSAARRVPSTVSADVTPATPRTEGLGRLSFPNSGPPEAQEPFLRGVLLLHSFEYDDAAEAFREARTRAPDFALAAWGEAMTHNHPIWLRERREQALDALTRLAPTPEERLAKARDERERGFLAAVEVLFGAGTREERADLYCEAMAELHARFPTDDEVAAFHALAILGSATQGRDIPTYMRAAAIAEEVLARSPDHPGALHYAIHSFDDPVHAPLGLRMARRYGVVAAAAEHALHMPSHIYFALGMWPDSVTSNVAAAAAADARRARKGLGLEARGFHALVWLAYSQLQLGRTAEATRLLQDMQRDEREKSTDRTRYHLAAMRAAHVVALQDWGGEFARIEVSLEGLEPPAAAAELYVRGRHALARDDGARARAMLALMEPQGAKAEPRLGESAGASAGECCAASSSEYEPGRKAAQVMQLELSGLLALHEGAMEEGLTRLTAAAEKEDEMGFDFGPPDVVEPAHELLGHVLLDLGRADEAALEFEAALRRAPGRARSLQGLERARDRAALQN